MTIYVRGHGIDVGPEVGGFGGRVAVDRPATLLARAIARALERRREGARSVGDRG